ncbi:MAG TPA: hypothetical protein VJT80_07155 [Steroidobacteraceae bacterium]|nr:hypothetical protein [Steroidobacteraceae bacterium]
MYKQLARADLVIGVVTAQGHTPGVLFELGAASAFGRRILLIASPKSDPMPFMPSNLLVLRVELDNEEAIAFALDQFISAPKGSQPARPAHSRQLLSLGLRAEFFRSAVNRCIAVRDWKSLEDVVAEVIRSSGADVVSISRDRDAGADLAVWSDVLEPFVGNPLLVEVKGIIRSTEDVRDAAVKLAGSVSATGSKWGLLLYGQAPPSLASKPIWTPPTILTLSLDALLDALRTLAFPELIRDLRNIRVHGRS